jgi:predicted RNase H-like HicB family nuclease
MKPRASRTCDVASCREREAVALECGAMKLPVQFDREMDGRWIAEVPELPGVMVYGESREAALAKVLSLAYTVLADEVQHGERDAQSLLSVTFDTREAA